MTIQIPGRDDLQIDTVILDLNGVLTVGGELVEGVKDRIPTLKEKGLRLILFSGDTRGNAQRIADTLGIEFIHTNNGEGKRAAAEKLNPETCASIGNGLIDLKMMEVVKLGIVTLQAEGVHTKTLVAVDIVVPTINDALDLFIDESRLIGTLRI